MMPVYYVQELGWSDTEFSGLSGWALLLGGGFSILFGGFILDFFGRVRAYMILCILTALIGLVVAALPSLSEIEAAMTAYRLGYNTLDTLVIVAFISIAMAISTPKVAATQFALYMALSNVGYTLGSAAFGPLQAGYSYPVVFVIFAALTLISILIMRQVSVADHAWKVTELQNAAN